MKTATLGARSNARATPPKKARNLLSSPKDFAIRSPRISCPPEHPTVSTLNLLKSEKARGKINAASLLRFNPRPTRRQAETSEKIHDMIWVRVSIHGPPEGRPKHVPPVQASSLPAFQSTAHPKAGRNTNSLSAYLNSRRVSIHGPPEGRPKLQRLHSRPCIFGFQSTAHPKAGRNNIRGEQIVKATSFNPRPTRRQAETAGTPRRNHSLQGVSIHGPPEGRPKRRGG